MRYKKYLTTKISSAVTYDLSFNLSTAGVTVGLTDCWRCFSRTKQAQSRYGVVEDQTSGCHFYQCRAIEYGPPQTSTLLCTTSKNDNWGFEIPNWFDLQTHNFGYKRNTSSHSLRTASSENTLIVPRKLLELIRITFWIKQ